MKTLCTLIVGLAMSAALVVASIVGIIGLIAVLAWGAAIAENDGIGNHSFKSELGQAYTFRIQDQEEL